MKTITMAVILLLSATLLAGCSVGIHRPTVTAQDGSWVMETPVFQDGNQCIIGRHSGMTFTNRSGGQMSSRLLTLVVVSPTNNTLGQIMMNCPVTYPGGSGVCTPVGWMTVPCNQVDNSPRTCGRA